MKKTKVYIAHPIGGDVANNLFEVAKITRQLAFESDIIPVAPYFLYCHALDDNDMAERIKGMELGLEYIKNSTNLEIWLYGKRISNGMATEIEVAQFYGFPVIPKTEGTKEDFKNLGFNKIQLVTKEDKQIFKKCIKELYPKMKFKRFSTMYNIHGKKWNSNEWFQNENGIWYK